MLENARTLLASLGKQLGLDDFDLDDTGTTALAFDEIVVNFDYLADADRLALYAEIGKPPAPDQTPPALLEALLKANFFHAETAGATIGMDRDTGLIVLYRTVDPDATEADDFFNTVEAFVDSAESWTARIVELATGEPESGDSAAPDHSDAMLRI